VSSQASQQRPPTPKLVFVLGFPIIGVVLAIGLYTGVVALLASTDTKETQGTVVELESGWNGRKTVYTPIVEYHVAEQVHRFKGGVASAPPMHTVGEQVQVLYKIDNPEVALIDSFTDRWLGPLIFTAGGSFFLVVWVWALIRQRAEARR
jgi:hypothetical protein